MAAPISSSINVQTTIIRVNGKRMRRLKRLIDNRASAPLLLTPNPSAYRRHVLAFNHRPTGIKPDSGVGALDCRNRANARRNGPLASSATPGMNLAERAAKRWWLMGITDHLVGFEDGSTTRVGVSDR
jgi:hypothetical protein